METLDGSPAARNALFVYRARTEGAWRLDDGDGRPRHALEQWQWTLDAGTRALLGLELDAPAVIEPHSVLLHSCVMATLAALSVARRGDCRVQGVHEDGRRREIRCGVACRRSNRSDGVETRRRLDGSQMRVVSKLAQVDMQSGRTLGVHLFVALEGLVYPWSPPAGPRLACRQYDDRDRA
jgi:hypothetical protein